MKKIKKVLWILLAILGVFALILGIFIQTLKPTYSGEKPMPKLAQEVKTYYDTFGIPHIYAKNEPDAFRTLGYVHAQDRLWQMELLRRIAKGELSEVFGKDMVRTDQFFLSLGIDEATKETVADLDKSSVMVQLSQAYLDGINQFIAEGPTPIEFYLTGIEKRPFTLDDIYNTMGYMGFSFAMAFKTDPLLTDIKENLGSAYLKDLEIDVDPNTTWIKNYNQEPDTLKNTISDLVANALDELPVPLFVGSNSWVLGPDKTKNGQVILANDPHIEFAQPAVWYEAHVSTPRYEKYGYHIAGVPFPLLGHDRSLAYGLTMFENDDIDFYYETQHPMDSTKYKTESGWESYQIVTKTIKVKDGDSVSFSYKKTDRGPVLNGIADQITQQSPISMSWVYTNAENKLMEAIYGMSHAQNIDEFQQAIANIHAPGLNIMYGDVEGNIAWWATAKLYQIPDSVHTKFIIPIDSNTIKPRRHLDFSENPQAINPPWNYVYSANNQPDSIAGMLYPGYYLPENRAKRIVALLAPKNDWDKEGVSNMITDNTSPINPGIVTNLAKSVILTELSDTEIKVLDDLSAWQGDYPLESMEAVIFHRWIYYFLKNTFLDEMGEDRFKQFLKTHFHKRLIDPLSAKENSVWWDDINTEDKVETQQDIIHKAFIQALESLNKDLGPDKSQWTWNKVHTIEHGHPMGQVEALRSFFNVGPFPIGGSREVINNLAFPYDESGQYKVSGGPSTRRIIDFSDIENAISILPTGQSGNPFSSHYDDQAEMYVQGEFRKMMLNKREIQEKAKDVLVFVPNKER
ncbi:penicillin acylase family protein [Spongiimicrobium sp. 3-5]|uniref:penicillin acylase family protein n=1 Tax=Spongiimicrobium sp. 3-5 TaxID=3332596 RepID=UPI00397F2E95